MGAAGSRDCVPGSAAGDSVRLTLAAVIALAVLPVAGCGTAGLAATNAAPRLPTHGKSVAGALAGAGSASASGSVTVNGLAAKLRCVGGLDVSAPAEHDTTVSVCTIGNGDMLVITVYPSDAQRDESLAAHASGQPYAAGDSWTVYGPEADLAVAGLTVIDLAPAVSTTAPALRSQ